MDIPILAQVVILVALLVILLLFALWLITQVKRSWTQASREERQTASEIITMLVKAAEQVFGPRTGEKKKEYVVGRALAEFEILGIKIDVDLIFDMLEAAILSELKKLDMELHVLPPAEPESEGSKNASLN